VLCQFHGKPCTFVDDPPKKKRRVSDSQGGIEAGNRPPSRVGREPIESAVEIRRQQLIKDYAHLRGPSLLKQTLGLQNHRHSSLIGPTSVYEPQLLGLPAFRPGEDLPVGLRALRKVSATEAFVLEPDVATRNHDREMDDLDTIESLVAPHGRQLIDLYFRIVHPTFPILHKKVFLEKYERTYREFSPPLLAAVYLLTLNWWSYSAGLSPLPKPDERRLEEMALRTMGDVVHRPKLSTIQAGLLLLQRPDSHSWSSWALTSQLVGLGQDLGLHLNCAQWQIPQWEKGLRRRVAWALYMQDKWGSLVHGRPSHITAVDWDVPPVDASDFPESAADEDDEEGSTEVEKGRVLFCEMISLARLLADVLREFYSVAAEAEARANAAAGVAWVLRRAKPLQLRLKSWFADLPDCLRLQDVGVRKLSSTGSLHLAYYATEITLHRRIVSALGRADDGPDLARVCRLAARERLVNALDFVNMLRPEHLQSFWYSASTYSFALIGTFISLLWVTSAGPDDAAFYKKKLDEYRWSLRLASKGSEVLEHAIALLSASTGVLVKAVPDFAGRASFAKPSRDLVMHGSSGLEVMYSTDEENAAFMISPGFDGSEDEGGIVQPLDQEDLPWLNEAAAATFSPDAGDIVLDHLGTEGQHGYLSYDIL
jgi:hypothetical protein